MDLLYRFLDWIFYGLIEPLFITLGQGLSLVLLRPLEILQLPVALQVTVIAILTALLSFTLRHLLQVNSRQKIFRNQFVSKRKQQDNVKYISDWKTRDALYRRMNQDIDEDFNTYLAQHFVRYVTVYMLPIFLVMAWLNTFLSNSILIDRFDSYYILPLNIAGIEGLTVTGVFLIVYIAALVVGFRLKRYSWSFEKSARMLPLSRNAKKG